jgi:ssDNA-binding Zn-finger/Zn-ribbon topoisomerase 1
MQMANDDDKCPKCGNPLGEITETKTGRKLQRCSTGLWNPQTKKIDGCDFTKWLTVDPETLDEKCPKCGSPLVLQFTRFGKKMKKCSTGGWDKDAKKATGCDFVEWVNSSSSEPLDIDCPECGKKLVLFTTNSGKKMEKCSTAGWDKAAKKATGCTYIRWLKPGEIPANSADLTSDGEEFLPPPPEEK